MPDDPELALCIDLDSWREYSGWVKKIRKNFLFQRSIDGLERDEKRENTLLFRGQSNHLWPLRTTLERRIGSVTLYEYLHYAQRCFNEIESFTGNRWNLKPFPEMLEQLKANPGEFGANLPDYEYHVYLRHHGFPSPLLDWTASPHIALFFAYMERSESDRVAVYSFVDSVDGMKSYFGGAPTINVMGPFVTTHARHFIQKAMYTLATIWRDDMHVFCHHEDAVAKDWPTGELCPTQDILLKVTLPSSDRHEVLKYLDEFNLNFYTLFQSEDALIKSLAIKLFDMQSR